MAPFGEVLVLLLICVLSVFGLQYDMYQQASSWYEARDTCSRDNKRLVHVDEELEHIRIKNTKAYIFQHFWIGLKKKDNAFKWTDDSALHFTAWGQGQPGTQSPCVRYNLDLFLWETHNCSAALRFMCENDVAAPMASGTKTMSTGLLIGLGVMVALLLVAFGLLQLPCCRSSTVKAIGHLGLGRR